MSGNKNYNNFDAEVKAVREYLASNNATATMVAVALDIYRPNLCRHKITLQRQGVLIVTHTAACKETGRQADYLSCNPNLIKEALCNK